MNQPIKRRNPFETTIRQPEPEIVEEEKKEVQNEPVKEIIEEEIQENPTQIYDEPVRPVVRQVKQQQKSRQIQPEDDQREKYTSTMEVTLRRRIKIVCATRGIMFSEFIEDACREKLRREGER